jgi:hypothetical protein
MKEITMLQSSKIYQSRNDWRNKAVERADEIREYRKTRQRHKDTIYQLKEEIKILKHQSDKENLKKI